jgi:hypothetical protein
VVGNGSQSLGLTYGLKHTAWQPASNLATLCRMAVVGLELCDAMTTAEGGR